MSMHTSAPHRHPFTKTALGAVAALGLAVAALLAAAAPAQAHDQLIDSAIEQSDSGEATALRLSFNNNVLEMGTEMMVTDAAGGDATNGDPKVSGRDVTLPLNAPLPNGSYNAVWRVVSSDGHPIEGSFSFDVSDGKASELRGLDPDDHDAADPNAPAGGSGDPDFSVFAPYLAIGAGLAAVIVLLAIVMRARKNAAARGTTQDSPEQE